MELSQNTGVDGKSLQPFNSSDDYEILETSQITEKIINIIERSEEFCYIITPYFDPWIQAQISFKFASIKNKKIIFFFRYFSREDKKENYEKEINSIKEFHKQYKFDIVFINNLHAKIYINENEALITSMNLYNYSKEKNFEIGVLIKNKDKLIKIKDVIKRIFMLGKEPNSHLGNNYYNLLTDEKKPLFFEYRYCYICKKPIELDHRYFCDDCHDKYPNYKELDPKGKYCRKCGKEAETTSTNRYCKDCKEYKDKDEKYWSKKENWNSNKLKNIKY